MSLSSLQVPPYRTHGHMHHPSEDPDPLFPPSTAFVTRKERNCIIRVLSSALNSLREGQECFSPPYSADIQSIEYCLSLLKKPTWEVRYFSEDDRKLVVELVERYGTRRRGTTEVQQNNIDTTESPLPCPKDCVQCSITLSKKRFAGLLEMLEEMHKSNDLSAERRKICAHVLAQLRGVIEVEVLSRDSLMDRVEQEMGEPIPKREDLIRVWDERGGTSYFTVSTGENCTRLFYREAYKLRTDLNFEDYCTKEACAVREVIAWVLRNEPELDAELNPEYYQ